MCLHTVFQTNSDSNEERQIVLGVCAMAKKSCSKPMQEILDRLARFEYIQICVFDERVILEEAVENWPLCDALISFHSKGFPLEKAVRYSRLRKPMCINDLQMQYSLMDRWELRIDNRHAKLYSLLKPILVSSFCRKFKGRTLLLPLVLVQFTILLDMLIKVLSVAFGIVYFIK